MSFVDRFISTRLSLLRVKNHKCTFFESVWADESDAVFTVIVGFFFGSMTLLEGKGISEARERISQVRVFQVVCSLF